MKNIPFFSKVAYTCLFSLCITTANAATLIHAGKVIPANSDQVLTEITIVIEQNKIKSVEKGFITPGDNDEVVDLRNHTVMPGLMDMHTHISSQQSGMQGYLERFTLNEADYALKGVGLCTQNPDGGFHHGSKPRRWLQRICRASKCN